MHESELERIERRLLAVERLLQESRSRDQRIWALLQRIEGLLEPPTTYPASSAGSITVK